MKLKKWALSFVLKAVRFVVFFIFSDNEIQTTCLAAKEAPSPGPTSLTLQADKLIVSEGTQLSKDVINTKVLSGKSWVVFISGLED